MDRATSLPDPALPDPAPAGTTELLDLTSDTAADHEGLLLPVQRPYNPHHDRERKRGLIALLLVLTLVGIVAVSLADVLAGGNVDRLRQVLEVILAPIVALVGAVSGFYFGEKSRGS